MAKPQKPSYGENEWDAPPEFKPTAPANPKSGWRPNLNPTQQKLFDETAKFVLSHGEKGSGKSCGCGHALVRHCYENKNAFALIIAPSIRTGKEGILYDLVSLVLPAWRDGNREPEYIDGKRNPKAGELMDSGLEGFQFTEPKQDPDTKDRVVWVSNCHGGWSKILLVSIPYAEAISARVKGPAPSFVYAEEVTDLSSDDYFTLPAAQLGRRRDITGPQQYYASCNPDGPSHWVYKRWWVLPVDEKTGKRDKDYVVYHVPVTENLRFLPPGYVEQLRQLFKDPIMVRRLIHGEWVDRPSGSSIFKNYFVPEIHVKGDADKHIGIRPVKSLPIIVGIDPGPANYSMHLEQMVPTKERTIWTTFDEINLVGQHKTNFQAAKLLLKRMDFWQNAMNQEFKFMFIADEAAFTQANSDGSFDALELERFGDGRIKVRGCPKGKDSVKQRVNMAISMFIGEQSYISATCPKTLDMVRMLSSAKPKPGVYDPDQATTPVKSIYKHPFDSWTYPPFYFTLQPGRFILDTGDVQPEAYSCGRAVA